MEPREWVERRLTPNADYEAIPELRESLLKEQGYLCAYCQRRIPLTAQEDGNTSKIEHVLPQSGTPDQRQDYKNLVACCPGYLDFIPHCDKSKEAAMLSINLFSDTLEEGVSYQSRTGKIVHQNPLWDREMNSILNLNHFRLQQNRHQALEGLKNALEKKQYSKREVKNYLKLYMTPNQKGNLHEYCGILRWYLRRKLTSISTNKA